MPGCSPPTPFAPFPLADTSRKGQSVPTLHYSRPSSHVPPPVSPRAGLSDPAASNSARWLVPPPVGPGQGMPKPLCSESDSYCPLGSTEFTPPGEGRSVTSLICFPPFRVCLFLGTGRRDVNRRDAALVSPALLPPCRRAVFLVRT